MTSTTVTKIIAAPIDQVFDTIADVQSFAQAIPHIARIDLLSKTQRGVGTRFRETRVTKGRKAITDVEITECVANDRVRMVTDTHGSIWDTLFALQEVPGGTRLTLTMQARAHQFLAKLMNPMVMPTIHSHIETDLDSVKRYCEAQGAG